MSNKDFQWKSPKNKNKLYLVFKFDYLTSEPVPIGILDWEHAKLFHENNEYYSIVPYELNKLDKDTIKNYKFKIRKIPGWDFKKKEDKNERIF